MTVLFPTSIGEAVDALTNPGAQVLAGGTDFMVEVNGGRRRLETVVSLRRIAELREWQVVSGPRPRVRLGAAVTYTDLMSPALAPLLPALAQAARTVGSPPIRNAGTIGGNLGTASPAGDTLPVLAALEAVVEVAGPDGARDVALADFVTGPKRNALLPGELIVAVRVPVLRGHQEYRKVGVRNAMVIAVASLALAIDVPTRSVRCALGSVGPVPLRAREAERWLADAIDWDGPSGISGGDAQRPGTAGNAGGRSGAIDVSAFGRLVAEAARPIDDHRSTASYRRHAIGILAARTAAQALASLGPEAGAAA